MEGRIGQQLGNYRLIRRLGRGGFAEVYLGEHLYVGTLAAIKVLHTQLATRDLETFRQEARIIASLEHPHIVRMFDFGVQDGIPYLIMSYASGGTLRDRHPKGKQLSLPAILDYVRQITQALQYAHDKKLIHRDIKPENMLIGQRGEIVLSDFGIALIAQSSRYQSIQDMAGTIAYMAPEQIQAHPRPASDQYALGVVVYEWIVGERPFTGSFTEIAAKHCLTSPPPLREKLPELPVEIEHVVLKAMAKDPKDRFNRVQDFAAALEKAIQEMPSASSSLKISTEAFQDGGITDKTAIDTSSTRSSHQAQPDNRLEKTTPLSPPVSAPSPQHEVTDQIKSLSSKPLVSSTETSFQKHISQASTSLDRYRSSRVKQIISRRTALLGLTGLVGISAGLVWFSLPRSSQPISPASGSQPISQFSLVSTYTGHTSGVIDVAWSFNSQFLASRGSYPQGPTLHVWNAPSGKHIYKRGNANNSVNAFKWSPKELRMASAFNSETPQVQVWDAIDGSHIAKYNEDKGITTFSIYALAWSPSGNQLVAGGEVGLCAWNTSTGNLLYYSNASPANGIDIYNADKVTWSPDGQKIAAAATSSSSPYFEVVQVWNAADGSHVYTHNSHTSPPANSGPVNAMAWSPDSKHIASGSSDKTVQVWDVSGEGKVLTYQGHTTPVSVVAWSPTGDLIASLGQDGIVQVWNAHDGSNHYHLGSAAYQVTAISWSPHGTFLVAGMQDGLVQVWNGHTGVHIFDCNAHNGAVLVLAWSPDQRFIASGSLDQTVKIWSLSSK